MIEELIRLENCRFQKSVPDWKAAIRMALHPLLEGGYITEEYETSVLENVEKFGPYFVLTPDMALVHAGPDKGVLGTQMAITVLEEPVRFTEDGHPVRVLAALAATDSTGHMEGIRAMSNIFMDNTKVEHLLNTKTPQELWQLFMENAEETAD